MIARIRAWWKRVTGVAYLEFRLRDARKVAERERLRAAWAADEHAKAGVEDLARALDNLSRDLKRCGLPEIASVHVNYATHHEIARGVRALDSGFVGDAGPVGYRRLLLYGIRVDVSSVPAGAVTLYPEDATAG